MFVYKTYFAVYYFVYFFFNRSVSRTASCEEMDEDFILKITNLGIFYKDYCNRKTSLEYLIYTINDQYQDIINYKNISISQNLKNVKKEINDHFNTFFNYLDKKYKDLIKSGDQLAFMFCRKKKMDYLTWIDGKKKKVSFPSRKESILKMKYLNN